MRHVTTPFTPAVVTTRAPAARQPARMFPDPLDAFRPDARAAEEVVPPPAPPPPRRRLRLVWPRGVSRRWLWGLLALPLLMFGWLSWQLPLDRALEPLPEATLVLLDAQGRPYARRGQYKAPPV